MTVTIYVGDAIERLRDLPAESVQTCITSPPYYGLRSYLDDDDPDKAKEIGLQETPEEYIAKLVAVFREVRRVLRADGVVWLNIGDSYASGGAIDHYRKTTSGKLMPPQGRAPIGDYKPKDLMMIPARVALALQADGWWLRSAIVWHKPNAMPESVTDRPTTDYEMVYLLAKSERYFYDSNAIKEDAISAGESRGGGKKISSGNDFCPPGSSKQNLDKYGVTPAGRNKRTVWTISTKPFSEAHFATFPPDLIEPMVKAGTSERGCCPDCGAPWERVTEKPEFGRAHTESKLEDGLNGRSSAQSLATKRQAYRAAGYESPPSAVTVGWQPTCDHDAEPVPCTVLDPFAGAGTTGLVADRLGRDAILIELNEEYANMAARRLYQDAGMFADVEVS